MECVITKDKIKKGISETVTMLVNKTGLFDVDGVNVIARNQTIPSLPELDEEQLKKIEESKINAKDIVPLYRPAFEQDPIGFLKEIAHQANTSESESEGALNNAGLKLYQLAIQLFPTYGQKTNEQKAVDDINKDFRDEVLVRTSPNSWVVHPSDDLAITYMMAQPGKFNEIMDTVRAKYLSHFTSASMNLIDEDLWLNHPILKDPTLQQLLNFAKKINPNFIVSEFDDLDQNAVSLIRDHIILVKSGSIIDELPHEVSHFFFELLPDDHPLKVEMMEKIVDLPIYSRVFQQYKDNPLYQNNSRPDVQKIKREAAAQQIGEYIKAAYAGTADSVYGKKRSLWKRLVHDLIKFLRKMFHINSPAQYTEPVMDINSPFFEASQQILKGDISNLNVQKVPSVYDSIFLSAVENELSEGFEASDIVKSMHEMTKAMKRQIATIAKKQVSEKNMAALKDELDDPKNKDYNKVWDIVYRLDDATKAMEQIISNLNEKSKTPGKPDNDPYDYVPTILAAQHLAESYRALEEIPDAITRVLKKMEKASTEDQLINNINELQMYFNFSDSFKKIGKEFISLLSFIRNNYPNATKGEKIYDTLKNNMGKSGIMFDELDEQLMTKLKDHLLKLQLQWTDNYLKSHRKELEDRYKTAETKAIKLSLMRDLEGKFTSAKHFRDALMGNFPEANSIKLGDGSKINISRLKDMSQRDYAIFLFTSPTLIDDPFISNVMAYFNDVYMQHQLKGSMEAKAFADSIAPDVKSLNDSGMDWYEVNRQISTIQSFYDYSAEDNKTEKRTLLSSTNRFDFQYEKQKRFKEKDIARKNLDKLQGELLKEDVTDERLAQLKNELIPAMKKEFDKLQEDYDKWLREWSQMPFLPKYYEMQDQLKETRTDSSTLIRVKQINTELVNLELEQFAAFIFGATFETEQYDLLTMKIAKLQSEKAALKEKLPPTEQAVYDLMDEMFEVDEIRTSRLRFRHKTKWVNSMVAQLTETGGNLSRTELEEKSEKMYDDLFILNVPTQEFYDKRGEIFDKINGITIATTGLEKLAATIDELKAREKKLLTDLRDFRGEVNLGSLKHRAEQGKMLSESLKDIELELDALRQRQRVYSVILSTKTEQTHKDRMIAYLDLALGFSKIVDNSSIYKADDVQKAFSGLLSLTTSQAEKILSAVKNSLRGDNTEFNNLRGLATTGVSQATKEAYATMTFDSLEEMLNAESQLFVKFKEFTRKESGKLRDETAGLYEELNSMYSNSTTLQYNVILSNFLAYYKEYIVSDYESAGKEIHREKLANLRGITSLVSDVEELFADGTFDAVIDYLEWKSAQEPHADDSFSAADTARYFVSIHKKKVSYVDGDVVSYWTPIKYVRKVSDLDESLVEKRAPRFLTVNRVKESLRNEKIYETDEEVIAGNKQATVDINGQWLPLEKEVLPENGGFWNAKYAKLKSAKSGQDKQLFDLLEKMKLQYLQKQQETLPEGHRLDLVVPAKHIDKLEQKKFLVKQIRGVWDYIRNSIPLLNSPQAKQEEEEDYLQDIKAITPKNRDIYTGLVISESKIKLRSLRRIPIERTSEDIMSSLAMFFEDINEMSAKTIVAPIMKSFADAFKHTTELYPHTNKWRANALTNLYETKILDEVPKNFANNKHLAKALAVINRFVGFRLMGDPIGGLVNLVSGEMQILIANSISKEAAKVYAQTGNQARRWLFNYDKDFWQQSNWSLPTQLIAVFNMIPDAMDISNQLSTRALLANIRSKLMAPRAEGEKYMAIHVGLSVVMAEPIPFGQETLTIEDIYELDPVTNLVRLKDEYKSLAQDWHPLTGKRVIKLRRKIMQFYTIQQGNFFKQNQSFASTTAIGKTMEVMKRWFPTGLVRSFHGRTRDPNTGEERVGQQFAMASLLGNFIASVWTRDFDRISDYWNNIAKRPSEMMALRKSLAEIVYTTVFIMLTALIFGYDDDDEDKNDKVREMNYIKQLALLVTMRVQSELGTFIPLPIFGLGYMEMKRAILDPIGLPKMTVDNIAGVGKLTVLHILDALGVDYDKQLYYQRGKPYGYDMFGLGAFKDKGDSKWAALVLNTIGYTGYTFEPAEYIKTFTQMQNRIK